MFLQVHVDSISTQPQYSTSQLRIDLLHLSRYFNHSRSYPEVASKLEARSGNYDIQQRCFTGATPGCLRHGSEVLRLRRNLEASRRVKREYVDVHRCRPRNSGRNRTIIMPGSQIFGPVSAIGSRQLCSRSQSIAYQVFVWRLEIFRYTRTRLRQN
jgi:hypothetical protein